MSGVEHNQFILVGLIIAFIIGQEHVGPQIRKDISNAVDEDESVLHLIFQFDMGLNPLVDIFIELDQARIRVQISAGHEREHLDKCIAAFIKVGKELGVLK